MPEAEIAAEIDELMDASPVGAFIVLGILVDFIFETSDNNFPLDCWIPVDIGLNKSFTFSTVDT